MPKQKNDKPNIVKDPYVNTYFADNKQFEDFIACCDPNTGYKYFMDNFFFIQHPTRGAMQYHPYDYQEELIDTYHNYRYAIALMGRQMGKTVSAAGYLLWYSMFVPDSTILIAANKMTSASEIMTRVRYAYENCPDHIRCGVTAYNKFSIEFENGSRIVSATTTLTTGRGMSISLLYLDEFAFVPPTIAKEFWTSISSTLATGGKCIITSTPNSDEDQFAELWHGANKTQDAYGNETELGTNGFRAYKAVWNQHPERDEAWGNQMQAQLGEDRFRREMNCISGDSEITVRDRTGKVQNMSLRMSTTSNSKMELNRKDLRVEEFVKNNDELEILTDSGWESFAGVLIKNKQQTVIIRTVASSIRCTLDHEVYMPNFVKKRAAALKPGDKILSTRGVDRVVDVRLGEVEQVYDILNAGKNHRFFANKLLVSNCEFLIADETLINASTLVQLQGIEPCERMGQVRWYQKPTKGELYLVALDPSVGTGGDPSGIQIYSGKSTTQIGEWKHNKTPIPEQIKLLAQICRHIAECTGEPNNIYYSIENNSVGEGALISLAEFGESNIPGTFMSEPGKKRKGFGVSKTSKLAACTKFKTLLETKKLKVHSKSLISELKTFVAREGSYAAKIGETDDLVMSSLLAIRMMQQLSSYDMELEDNIRDHTEHIPPMPFFAIIR